MPPARYRHPGDVIRLILAGLVLAAALAVSVAAPATYAGARAAAVTGVAPSTVPGRVLAGLVQVLFAAAAVAAPWLSRPWRRTAWIALWLAAVVRLVTGTASPVEVVVAFATGVTVGAGVLVLLDAPDRRIGPGGIAAALALAGLPVACVEPAASTQRQMALDVAELLASLATMIGAGRAVGSAAAVIGPDGVAVAVPRVLQRREYV